MLRSKKNSRIFNLLVLTLVLVSCSPEFRYKVANAIFDDVPSIEEEDEVVVDTSDNLASPGDLTSSTGIILEKKIYYHDPFQNKECSKCHDQQHIGALVAEEPELCYQCHEEQTQKHNFKHGPAEAGLCTSCHQPHKANAGKLLLEDGVDLCLSCHDSEDISRNRIHKEIKDQKSCLECHDPHAGDNRFMMKKGTCIKCHDKVDAEEFSHGPVAGDFCSSCHDSHNSKNEHLLVLDEKDLCLNCHEPLTVFKNELHKNEENTNCTNCHDSHGGPKKFMLN
jgi:predicted CXXCH cytochrome family protein